MTGRQQLKELSKIGCEDAVREIKRTRYKPLSSLRLEHYLIRAINGGFVRRAVILAQMKGSPLETEQLERLIKRCIELDWVPDAVFAASQGTISKKTRRKLIRILVRQKHVDDDREAARVVDEIE